ncbi:EAL domain-containing protein [Sphingomonas sp. PP-CC-3G-468]|uniref:sensor domain-containing phosphodiesterase n=1 Tax=Sphingomonas sp. PP-CC-3G-468 TaxID=2135656 RepID=UPI001052C359|nr:EAL domain-containing protein [Sphingomonas sp. PP-CC-3G-468]TCL99916.1 PAS domain S-box-containing protein/diguanylate cyclase (GGDEF)-like protein [Sphingomonas sp. PP-CC-3G-468]
MDKSASIEGDRLDALYRYSILDSGKDAEIDHITELAAVLNDAPMAAVTFTDFDRQWLKSTVGISVTEVGRDIALCAQAILSDDILEVCDAQADQKYANNPLVTSSPNLRYYAGAPLMTRDGFRIGAICFIDDKPRPPMSDGARVLLAGLAKAVMYILELRKSKMVGRIATLIADTTSDAIVCADTSNVISYWNSAAEEMFGWPAAEAIGQSLDLIVPERRRSEHAGGLARLASGEPPRHFGKVFELDARHQNGTEIPIELSLASWFDEVSGRPAGFAAIIRDISVRKKLELERQRSQALLDTVIEAMPVILSVKSIDDGRYTIVNKAFEALTGLPRDKIIGCSDDEVFSRNSAAMFRASAEVALKKGEPIMTNVIFDRPGQVDRVLRVQKLGIEMDGDGKPTHLLRIAEDITEKHNADFRIRYLAQNDALTGLINRTTLLERLSVLLHDADHADQGALICLDLDRFKIVNELHGHEFGDYVLVELAARLTCIGGGDALVARLGGDEFAVLCKSDPSGFEAMEFACRIINAIRRPIMLSGRVAHLDASIGVAVFPTHGTTATDLLRNADLALYRSKAEAPGTASLFDASMDHAVKEQRMIEAELRTAISKGDVYPVYQPILCLRTNQVTGFEVLARWHHHALGNISPATFIPIAEESGLIAELSSLILETAAREAQGWSVPLKLAVNLSPVQLMDTQSYDQIVALISRIGLDPARLEFEVTEGFLIHDTRKAVAILDKLKAFGCKISMDDFGTGYSSLTYLRLFPFDKVKIDQSFVRDMVDDVQARVIVRAVVSLGSALGLHVVAEGVESEDQMILLKEEGCSFAQGFHIGRPEKIAHFRELLV